MKRAQIKYTGQPYVFYNKLRNIGQQYGVYLKPLNQIKYGFSLCPEDHDEHTFDDEEYHQMAAALYEKFADTQCISEDYQRIRNIIDRYNEDNDGYQILYEIMEDAHPALQQDSIYRAPQSTDCDNDIQEYTARFQVFLTSETLKHRYYTPKDQVLHYLEGLDAEFNPAVTYIKTLMDSWGSTAGLPPKCDMRVLPKTIADHMEKESNHNYPQIRTAMAPAQASSTGQPVDEITKLLAKHMDDTTSLVRSLKDTTAKQILKYSNERRQSVDVFCNACGGHGHKVLNCDFVARLSNSLDFIASLDAAKKKEIMDAFQKEQNRRRQFKQTDRKGRARVLRDTGDIEGLYNLATEHQGDDDDDSQTGMDN